MPDVFLPAAIRSARLEIGVAISTQVCKDAQEAHGLATTSAIALGRLLTAVELVALTSKRKGTTSFQILSRSKIRQIFADATDEGHARGFVKNPDLNFPLLPEEMKTGRRILGPAVIPGDIYVVRQAENNEYTQSSTPLTNGEVDRDVECFLERSDQIPTALSCDVLCEGERITLAGGVFIQALPDGDLEALTALQSLIADGALVELLKQYPNDPEGLLRELAGPDAEITDNPVKIRWQCRCTEERVLGALKMLSPKDLVEMIEEGKPTEVGCDLCNKKYEVSPEQIRRVFEEMIKAEG